MKAPHRRVAACVALLAVLVPSTAMAAPDTAAPAVAPAAAPAPAPEAAPAPATAPEAAPAAQPTAAAEPPPPVVDPTGVPGPAEPRVDEVGLRQGKIARNTGIGLGVIGVVMLGAFGGLHAGYKKNCSDTLGSEDLERTCDDSLRANITVAALGATFLVGGAVLIGLGQARVNKAKRSRVAFVPTFGGGTAGASLVGRF